MAEAIEVGFLGAIARASLEYLAFTPPTLQQKERERETQGPHQGVCPGDKQLSLLDKTFRRMTRHARDARTRQQQPQSDHTTAHDQVRWRIVVIGPPAALASVGPPICTLDH